MTPDFDAQYKKLNKKQKEAVEALEGPVMVVAGPGTGKTQVLALRIANILKKTDIKVDGILALTFTNSAVEAMRERLVRYIGEAGKEVNIKTFHSFGMDTIGRHFTELGFPEAPKLMEEVELALFFDHLLHEYDWEHLRPRGDSARHFSDLKSLISLLKRERIGVKEFESAVMGEIERIKQSEENISSRGERKGELKKEAENEIERLTRTLEVAKFFKVYEDEKKKQNVFDYDDVLENLVRLSEDSDDVASEIREKYLYVLIDEHQDSSRVQNEFLIKVWGKVERPDIFVVGDDRQLIYGFSGASIDHFQAFRKTFKGARLITLLDNYRSTQVILDASHALLESVLSPEKLQSQSKEHHPIRLVEASNPREEIISAGLDIRDKIKRGVKPEECAILVPNNAQARQAMEILHQMDLPVSSLDALHLFDQKSMQEFLRVLKIISNGDRPSLALSFWDGVSGVSPMSAHKFFVSQKSMREFSLARITETKSGNLFDGESAEDKWARRLLLWHESAKREVDLKTFIGQVGRELFVNEKKNALVSGGEIVDSVLNILESELKRNPRLSLSGFIEHMERLEQYNDYIPLLAPPKSGVKVLTMHSSKGLEFEWVWIAHMDERSLFGARAGGFALPQSIKERVLEQDIDAVKRKLYVAITRAKKYCTLSYSRESRSGGERDLARIIAELPEEVFSKEKAEDSKKEMKTNDSFPELEKLVAEDFKSRNVSAWLLNNFFECPWKWYFASFLNLPEPKSEHLSFGALVHSAIDRILKMKNPLTEEDLHKIVAEEVASVEYPDPRLKNRAEREAFALLQRWAECRLPEVGLGRKMEENVSVKDPEFPDFKIYGRIDLIENLGGDEAREVRVTDFKTGHAKRKSEIEKTDEENRMSAHMRQLAMYTYLLKNSPWRVDVRESRLEFLEAKNPKEAIYDTIIKEKELGLLLRDIKDYESFVKSGEWTKRGCNAKLYGKNTKCEYCKLAEIYE
ncbi:MAG: ATP-dependent DNA helicase [Candidatus Paceibacterota bacterium]